MISYLCPEGCRKETRVSSSWSRYSIVREKEPFSPDMVPHRMPTPLPCNRSQFRLDYWLLIILTIAFVLRVWGVWNAESSDEYNEIFEALRVCSGHLNLERWSKRFYLYILAVEYGVYYIIGWIFQLFQSPDDFAVKIIRDPYPLFLLGRITSAFLGTGSVWLTYLVGRQLYGTRFVGLLAALFLCFNAVNIELSHYARVDASLCFVVLAAFYWIAKIATVEKRLLSWYVLAGIFSGIAFQNKMQAVILLIPFAYAHLSGFSWKRYRDALFTTTVLVFCLSYLAGLVVGNPAVLFAPVSFVKGLLASGVGAYTIPINETVSTIGYVVYLRYFFDELGLPLALLAVASIIFAVFSHQRREILLLSFIVPFYALMGGSKYLVSASYMIPLMPFLYILIAATLNTVFGKVRELISERQVPVIITVLILLLFHPVIGAARLTLSFSGKNTRVLAKEWIERNIPFGSKILMDSGKTINSFAPLIAENKISIQRTLQRKQQEIASNKLNDPTKMVDSTSLKYFEVLMKTVPAASYDITSTQFGLAVASIDYYLQNHFDYFIAAEGMLESRTDASFSQRHPEVAKFYRSLSVDKRISLVKVIAPSPFNRGQKFYIYKFIHTE